MKTHIIRILTATLELILGAVAAGFLPPLWHGVSGRDFRPQSTTMALLIFLLVAVLRRWRRWPIADFVGALICAELFTLCVIGHFSGFTWLEIFDSFNLWWLGTMSVFVGLPWLLGLLVGSLLLRVRQSESHDNAA